MRTSYLLLPAALALLALGGCAQFGTGGSLGSNNSQFGEQHDDWLHGPAGPFPDNPNGGSGGGRGGGGRGGGGHR